MNATKDNITELRMEANDLPSKPTIYTVGELANNPKLLHDVVSVINTAFAQKDADFSPSLRFPEDQDLIQQFGMSCLCSVIRSGGRVIATASVQRWREPEGSLADNILKERRHDYHLVEAGRSYEVNAVATVLDERSRKKGLATQCIQSIVDAILLENEGKDILLWIHTAEAQNGAYWRRRGFEEVLIETKPMGFWGAYEPFQFTTLVKRVSGGSRQR